MAWAINMNGTRAQVVAGINAIQPGNGVGQPAQLADCQAFMLSRVASYTNATFLNIAARGFRDEVCSQFVFKIEPITQTLQGAPIDGSFLPSTPG